GLVTGRARAGHGGEQQVELAVHGVDRQAGAGACGSSRNKVQNAWARQSRVACRFQPMRVRPSKWPSPSPVFNSR
ncbi:hypothetical protein, partial [Frankia sp. Cas3]|uniref:hypothetical protein n=1 Tax=Frankia sp. Cas3 TaxID=3073926 RepID=UPI002AD270AC